MYTLSIYTPSIARFAVVVVTVASTLAESRAAQTCPIGISYRLRVVQDDETDFRFVVRHAFTIAGRGTLAAGYIETGTVHSGDVLDWVRGASSQQVRVLGFEAIRQIPTMDPPTVGLIVSDLAPGDLRVGDILRSTEPK
jgi:translation elongation factor EF-Tu-like GTPase